MADAGHATADELLAHAGWIRTLALSLCRDTWMADDLVQETWLAALRRPPRNDRPLRPWLARVLRNFAYERRRQTARRGQHELVADPESARVDGVELEESETRAQLVECVLELREPYRSVVLLRYWGQLEPQEIARRQGIPSATVRTRLRRGLNELRERLERDADGDAQTAFLCVALVARIDVTEPVRSGSAIGGVLASTSILSRWVIGLLALVLTTVGVFVTLDVGTSHERAEVASPEAERAVPATIEEVPIGDEGRSPTTVPQERPDATPALGRTGSTSEAEAVSTDEGPLEPGVVAGRVLDGEGPLAGLAVYLAPGRRLRFGFEPGLMPEGLTTTMTDADGVFAFRGIENGPYVVAVERAGTFRHARVEVSGRPLAERTFEFGDAAVHGTVWDAHGVPVPRAIVRIARPGRDLDADAFQIWIEAGSDGRFEQGGLPPGEWRLSAKIDLSRGDDWRFDVSRFVTLEPGRSRRLDFGNGQLQPEWTGRVLTRSGAEVGRGHLLFHHVPTGCELSVTNAAGGSFARRLLPGEYDDVRWIPVGHHERDAIALAPFEVPSHDFARDVLLPGARLTGEVVQRAAGPAPVVHVRRASAEGRRPFRSTELSDEGTYAIDGLGPGRWIVWTSAGHLASGERELVVQIDEDTVEVRQDLRLAH